MNHYSFYEVARDAQGRYDVFNTTIAGRRLAHAEKKVDALIQCVVVLGIAQLVTLIAIGVIAAKAGL